MSVTSPKAKSVARQEGIALLAGMVALMWVVELINSVDNYKLDQDGLISVSTGVVFGPEGTNFVSPVLISIPYDAAS